jgi:hypothetical protein
MQSNTPLETSKKTCRAAWVVFWTGISLMPLGLAIWIGMTGVSPWLSPRQGEAHAILRVLTPGSFVICMVAPLFARVSFFRRLGFSVLAGLAGVADYYICGFLNLLLIGV